MFEDGDRGCCAFLKFEGMAIMSGSRFDRCFVQY